MITKVDDSIRFIPESRKIIFTKFYNNCAVPTLILAGARSLRTGSDCEGCKECRPAVHNLMHEKRVTRTKYLSIRHDVDSSKKRTFAAKSQFFPVLVPTTQ